MKLMPITLSVKRKAFRSDTPNPSGSDKVYIEARQRVLARDGNTCRFCGFRNSHNEVHHVNDDHEDHSLNNLVTACVLCHMSFHVAFAGIRNRGTIIVLPEAMVTQAELNQLVRHLWIAEAMSTGDIKNHASQLLERLEKAEIHATNVIGTSSAAVLGDYLSALSDEDYSKRSQALEGVYLLPTKAAYGSYIKKWCDESKAYPPEHWIKAAQQFFIECGGED